MLQFITKETPRYSVEEQVKIVIEGGCRWIELSAESTGESFATLKEVAEKVMPLCRDNNCFLVIDNDVDLVDELRVHGVFLNDSSREKVMEVRERFGGHAVIGVLGRDLEQIASLRGLDIDYVSIPMEALGEFLTPSQEVGKPTSEEIVEAYRRMADALNERNVDFHLVALGNFTREEMGGIVRAGFAGVAVSSEILDTEAPAATTAAIIETLENARASR